VAIVAVKPVIRISFLLLGVSLVVLAAVDAISPSRAAACSCLAMPADAAFETAASVFEGRVISIEPASEMQLEVRLRVVRTWKGADAEEVTVYTASQGATCGYEFALDRSYLVYTDAASAEGDAPGTELVSLCSNTKPVEDAAAELAELGPGATPVDPGQGLGAAPAGEEDSVEPPARGGCASCSAGGPTTVLPSMLVLAWIALRRRR
jgi:MYXO-CTERM domain-containing protein